MVKIGHNLLRYIDYRNFHNEVNKTPMGAMFYTDAFKENEDVSFKYRIALPLYCSCIMCRKS